MIYTIYMIYLYIYMIYIYIYIYIYTYKLCKNVSLFSKGHCRKEASLKTLRPASRQRYPVAGPQVTPMDSVTPGGIFENKHEEGSYAFSKVLLHKHNILSERLGMEPLQSAVS